VLLALRIRPPNDITLSILLQVLFILFFGKARLRLFLLKAFSSAFLFGLGARCEFALRIRFLDSFVDVRPRNIRHHARSENVAGNVSDLCSDVTDFPK